MFAARGVASHSSDAERRNLMTKSSEVDFGDSLFDQIKVFIIGFGIATLIAVAIGVTGIHYAKGRIGSVETKYTQAQTDLALAEIEMIGIQSQVEEVRQYLVQLSDENKAMQAEIQAWLDADPGRDEISRYSYARGLYDTCVAVGVSYFNAPPLEARVQCLQSISNAMASGEYYEAPSEGFVWPLPAPMPIEGG